MSKYNQISLGKKDKAHLTVVKNETSEKKYLTLRELSVESNIPIDTIRK
ncbi:MAG: hypothetical protein IH964_09235 [Candidatus Dadabacteria bacterium]|nr:hypothetical protein [Candidatus Dadabacteria bacterium]